MCGFLLPVTLLKIVLLGPWLLYFGPVRLSEFWRNLDGLEECLRNLGEENAVPDEKISGSRRV